MRIISGKYKGKRLAVRRSVRARPTTDIAKEGLFNVLANHIDFEGLRVLDLYAGTGSIGMEFLSRGAASVVLVEYDRYHVTAILQTIQKLEMPDVWVKNADAIRYCRKATDQYDLVFADPPFNTGQIEKIPDEVLSGILLKDDCFFVLEHAERYDFRSHDCFVFRREYGSVQFSFFKKK